MLYISLSPVISALLEAVHISYTLYTSLMYPEEGCIINFLSTSIDDCTMSCYFGDAVKNTIVLAALFLRKSTVRTLRRGSK